MQLHTILPITLNDLFLPRDDVPAYTSYQGSLVLCRDPYKNVAVDSR